MATALKDLLRRSFRMIGELRQGQTNNDDDITDAIYVLNDMLSSWSIDPLAIYTEKIERFTLVPSQQKYTIGPGGDFDTDRPNKIDRANLVMTNLNPELRRPIAVIDKDQWSTIKLQLVHSSIPMRLYYQPDFPIGNLYLWPYPDYAFDLELFSWRTLPRFSAITDQVTLPDGYSEAIAANLAVRLAAEWGKELRQDVLALAISSKANIESHNAPSPIMDCDSALLGIGGTRSNFNRLTSELE